MKTDSAPATTIVATPGRLEWPEEKALPKRNATFAHIMSRIKSVLKHVGLLAAAVTMIYPVVWMVVSSFRPADRIFREPGLIASDFTTDNYVYGWDALSYGALDLPFGLFMTNSMIVVIGCIIGNVFSCSLAAYAFARLKFTARTILFAAMLLTIMLPSHVVLVPQYIIFSKLGLVGTFWPLILPKLLATDSFFIFLMVQFIRGLPKELDEAALIDGCGHFRIFFNIIMPLMVPAIATTAIFTFIWTWNDFFGSMIYLQGNPRMYTVQLGLRAFQDSAGSTNWGSIFAMSVLSLVPIFLAFLFGQRFLIKGIATTGIK
ncbi:MAG: carbohydrate ABC transporter permease [Propionibacteriaceae bacterium]|jgi:multiple sugar transport system permease protein|nr:carbohydrate ABC transporter permease [Propionibacteriaceae bacterium]